MSQHIDPTPKQTDLDALNSKFVPLEAYKGRITTTDWTDYTLSIDISQKNLIFIVVGTWNNDEESQFLPMGEFMERNSTGSYVAFRNVPVAYTSNKQAVLIHYQNGTTISVKCENSSELWLKIYVI